MTTVREDMDSVLSIFIWTFKKGDNILYNFDILNVLCKNKNNAPLTEKKFYNKPITLIIISIIECIIEDFTQRAKYRTHDPLPNLTSVQEQEFKTKKFDKFDHFITVSRRLNLFDMGDVLYDALDYLRKIRNRFHIQNSKGELEADEYKVFTDGRLKLSQKVLEVVIKKMATRFPRQESEVNLDNLKFPWS